MMVMQYVIAVTHYLAERNGQPPESTQIIRELATRCLDFIARYREIESKYKQMEARAVDAEMRLAMYEVSRP